MVVRLDGAVSPSMLDKLMEAENLCPPEERLNVYLTTQGGCLANMSAIINVIDESEKIDVVFCYGDVMSAGFLIAMKVLKPVVFLENCMGMCHKGSFRGVPLTDELKISGDIIQPMKLASKNAKKITEDIIATGIFTKREEEKLRNNKDLYFGTKRLTKMREIVWKPIQEQIDKIMEEMRQHAEAESPKELSSQAVEVPEYLKSEDTYETAVGDKEPRVKSTPKKRTTTKKQ